MLEQRVDAGKRRAQREHGGVLRGRTPGGGGGCDAGTLGSFDSLISTLDSFSSDYGYYDYGYYDSGYDSYDYGSEPWGPNSNGYDLLDIKSG